MEEKCIRAIVSGQVQGVNFRASTRSVAEPLGITGHAKNLSDGTVEVLACGDDQALEELVEWLHKGPPAADVTNVDVSVTNNSFPKSFKTL
ncbi:acylphosphatase [Marinobacteraceae bacterium S3BR75-40.1]